MRDKDISTQSAVKRFNKLGGYNTGFGYNEPLCPVCRCLPHKGDCDHKVTVVGSEEMTISIIKAFEEIIGSLDFINRFESKPDKLDLDKVFMIDPVTIPLSENSSYLYDITVVGITTNTLKHKAFIEMEFYNKLGFRVQVTIKIKKQEELSPPERERVLRLRHPTWRR